MAGVTVVATVLALLEAVVAGGGGGSDGVVVGGSPLPLPVLTLPGLKCTFEETCDWKWNTTTPYHFRVVDAHEINTTLAGSYAGPFADATNNTSGHFLFLKVPQGQREFHVTSPLYVNTGRLCRIEVMVNMVNMSEGNFKVVVESVNASWVAAERMGNHRQRWEKFNFTISKVSREFRIILEFVTSYRVASQVALDDIKLLNCFPEAKNGKPCTTTQFQCSDNQCIDKSEVCDLSPDCPYGEDEEQDCDKLPLSARCNFEDGWCGWSNGSKPLNGQFMNWTRHNGSTPTSHTGPTVDHTYGNATGVYVYMDVSVKKMGALAILESAVFNRPPPQHSNVFSPYYNSCNIRFHYHKYGPHIGSLGLFLTEVYPKENRTSQLWWSFGGKGNLWLRQVVVLPNVTSRYFLQFEARKGLAFRGDIALDDISMSPECFGIGIPPTELGDYNYTALDKEMLEPPMPAHKDFMNKTYFLLGTCGVKGRMGPTLDNCTAAYNNTTTRVAVVDKPPFEGVQEWTVPEGGYYTLIAKGAKGGQGSEGKGASRGAIARIVIEFNKGQKLYILVGQKGTSGCGKDYKVHNYCRPKSTYIKQASPKESPLKNFWKKFGLEDGGGGGGGGTFIFLITKERPQPLLVAAGGGGLALNPGFDDGRQHGRGENSTLPPTAGNITGPEIEKSPPAGPGGGWTRNNGSPWHNGTGESLLQGGKGGFACRGDGWGGFGGGGGGCLAGGGGGGFTGGEAYSGKDQSGGGGYSFAAGGMFGQIMEGVHDGEGSVHIIPAIAGCQCDYRCVAMDEFRQKTRCLCPSSWYLGKDGISCILPPDPAPPVAYIVALASLLVIISLGMVCICLYSRYQRKREARMRRRMMHGPDLQLNRLREASNSIMTEYNPNYEFGGATYTVRDLKDIPRDHLRLVKALGQGAFGEVYQGFFRHRDGDAVEMPVAVKTLPELSTNQAESDFMMEALIMSKFSHPNIVHFIGVCFDKHPRFIVLELLAGGDLKTFLREARPKPERPSPLVMKDLLLCSMDVAKGCKYLENHHFIHRDIAARNCLLTTKGPGRVVKIADFGMARDIYRADYYRKGGKAMLPIKWMPPEAFLDGIFTTKTDVWSFGVLLWEVMSLGYMPYTGCANRDVMQLVTSGGRLEPPSNCPGPLYGIMTQCWHPKPEERPTFATILERLDYCLQDPDVVNAPLPVFYRPPSTERDATIMRPPAHENSCLQVQRNADYLVPLPCVIPELPSSPSANSVDKLLSNGLYDPDADWETSFVLPESRSTQPLLETEGGSSSSEATDKTAVVGSLVSLEKAPIVPAPSVPLVPTANHNNNNNNNTSRGGLKTSLSLDPSTLNVTKQPLPYVNVSMAPVQIGMNNLEPDLGRPFTVQGAAGKRIYSDTEISC